MNRSLAGWSGEPSASAPQKGTCWASSPEAGARPEIARVKHVDLDLSADFEARTLSGTATLDITGEPGATQVILDTRNLDIRSVADRSAAATSRRTRGWRCTTRRR